MIIYLLFRSTGRGAVNNSETLVINSPLKRHSSERNLTLHRKVDGFLARFVWCEDKKWSVGCFLIFVFCWNSSITKKNSVNLWTSFQKCFVIVARPSCLNYKLISGQNLYSPSWRCQTHRLMIWASLAKSLRRWLTSHIRCVFLRRHNIFWSHCWRCKFLFQVIVVQQLTI